jgi:AAA+ ATPase superfamily predicted ATPase
MKNPFKFGSVVEEPYFFDRVDETQKVKSILNSENHLIIISPRRYGKTSLINKVAKSLHKPYLILDLQLITTQSDFASQLLKRIYRIYPFQRIKGLVKNFRIIPSITLNPVTNEVDISYKATTSETAQTVLEDVFNLLEKMGTRKSKPIIILDEFQEIKRIGNNLDRILRSIIQHHSNVKYVFLGSQESLIRNIFEKKKSPFYHFGFLLPLDKIPYNEFLSYLTKNFKLLTEENLSISERILEITKCHPYYTQQLAFTVWELLFKNNKIKNPVETAVNELMRYHDIDYERLWNTINRTDMKILIGMSISDISPLSDEFSKMNDTGASSTVFSSLKRLVEKGFLVKSSTGYEMDDPFFKEWIKIRRLK